MTKEEKRDIIHDDGFIPLDRLRRLPACFRKFDLRPLVHSSGRVKGVAKVTFFVLIYILY